eukprot:4994886-Alexandrium_andersonii.AAC.1
MPPALHPVLQPVLRAVMCLLFRAVCPKPIQSTPRHFVACSDAFRHFQAFSGAFLRAPRRA